MVTNDYVAQIAREQPRVLLGASIHPYRRDAVEELERCIRLGAVLVKWLPLVQGFDPADDRCVPFYEALAHYRMPLLCHTGAENALPMLAPQYADPRLLIPALKMGVKVIAAHCATRVFAWETNFVPHFLRMLEDYEHLYGDTAAINAPGRWAIYHRILGRRGVREKLVHGSDWPIFPMPVVPRLGVRRSLALLRESNWLRRDVLIKREIGLDDEYWHRAAKVLGLGGGGVGGKASE